MIRHDFMVESNDHCFICQITINETKVEAEPVPMASSSSSHPIYSLHHLTRYLELDMGKVFGEGGSSSRPPELLRRVTWSNLNVALCEECANRNTAMPKLFQQLEKIKLEINSYLELVHGKLSSSATTANNTKFPGSMEKQDIVNVLRAEMLKKCSSKLGTTEPKVVIKKLTSEVYPARTSPMPSHDKEDMKKSPDSDIEPVDIITLEVSDVEESPLWTPFDDIIEGSPHSNEMIQIQAPSGQLASNNEIVKPAFGFNPKLGKYQCTICQKTFSQSGNCRRHVQNVHKGKRYECEDCHRTFTQQDSLAGHKRSSCAAMKQNKSPCHPCHICGKGFTERIFVQTHVKRVHLRLGERKCDQCGITFSSPHNLGMHFKAVHLQLREHDCQICGMKFKRKDALQGHQRALHKTMGNE